MGESRDRFMLHYNFPPFSTGEVGRMGAPRRREIGHGNLAKRALICQLPTAEDFQYSIRVVSEITESNGSRSEEHTSELQSRGHLVCRLLLDRNKGRTPAARPPAAI